MKHLVGKWFNNFTVGVKLLFSERTIQLPLIYFITAKYDSHKDFFVSASSRLDPL